MNWTSWVLGCALVLSLGTAHAQEGLSKKAAAEALFDQGLALMRERRYPEACLRLEQSQALEHGIGTMLYLGDCYDEVGRAASAWALFRQAASEARAAGQAERAAQASERAAAVEPQVAKLVVEAAPGAALDGLTLSIDDVRQPDAMWGVALPVDPGEHAVKVAAPGFDAWTKTVQVAPASTYAVTTPTLTASARGPAQAPVPSDDRAHVDRAPRSKFTRRLAISLGSVGVASALIGTGLGVRAIRRNHDAKDYCGGAVCNDPRGVELTNEGLTAARAANGLIVGGALLAAAGLTAYFYHPWDRASLALHVDGQRAELALGGAF
jgi:hypothetical protein